MATEILDLNALAPEHPLARIRWAEIVDDAVVEHDETFELLVPEEIGTLELSRITRIYTDHDELWEKEKRTAAEDKRLEKLANDLTQKLIPDAPATAVAALSAIAKRSLAVRFFVGAGLATQTALGPDLVAQLTNSSLGSLASTEEESDSGSTSPGRS
jgi:hypothetical protein